MAILSLSPKALRDARTARGISQRDAAAKAGVARATIQNAETGRSQPSAEHLARIASLYGVAMESLFIHAPEPHNGSTGRGPSQIQQPDAGASGANQSPRPAPHGG